MSDDFCHLHVHSEYSVLDGINKVGKLCKHIKESGMSACALTDHGNLHGAIEFYKAATKEGIKPLIGVEAYITQDMDNAEVRRRDNAHLILIAINETGLKNLFWLTNNANINNFYYNPRVWEGHLATRHEGLIVTSACLGGYVAEQGLGNSESDKLKKNTIVFNPEHREYGDPDGEALKRIKKLQEIFGDRFYLEIQDHESWKQHAYNRFLIETGKREKIPVVITSDAHFLHKHDFETHRLIMSQQLGKTVKEYCDGEEMNHYHHCYVKSKEEMLAAARKFGVEEAFHTTSELASRVDLKLTLGKYQTPQFDPTKEEDYSDFLIWRHDNAHQGKSVATCSHCK